MGGTQSGEEGTDCPAPPCVGGGRSPQTAMRTDRSSAKCRAARPVPESPPFPRTGRHKATFKMPATHFTSNPNAPAGPLGWEPWRVSGRSAGLSRLPVGGRNLATFPCPLRVCFSLCRWTLSGRVWNLWAPWRTRVAPGNSGGGGGDARLAGSWGRPAVAVASAVGTAARRSAGRTEIWPVTASAPIGAEGQTWQPWPGHSPVLMGEAEHPTSCHARAAMPERRGARRRDTRDLAVTVGWSSCAASRSGSSSGTWRGVSFGRRAATCELEEAPVCETVPSARA